MYFKLDRWNVCSLSTQFKYYVNDGVAVDGNPVFSRRTEADVQRRLFRSLIQAVTQPFDHPENSNRAIGLEYHIQGDLTFQFEAPSLLGIQRFWFRNDFDGRERGLNWSCARGSRHLLPNWRFAESARFHRTGSVLGP